MNSLLSFDLVIYIYGDTVYIKYNVYIYIHIIFYYIYIYIYMYIYVYIYTYHILAHSAFSNLVQV